MCLKHSTDQKAGGSSPSEPPRSMATSYLVAGHWVIQRGVQRVTRCDAPCRNVVHRLASVPRESWWHGRKEVQSMRQDQAASRVQPRRTRARWPCCALQGLPQHAVPPATRSVPTLACFYCGKEFPNPARRGPDRKFCSAPCKARWWREEYSRRRQAAPLRPCERCGGPVAHKTGRPVCKDCRVDDRSQPYRRDVQLKSLYGITQADYDRLLALQYGRCAICGTTKPGTRAPGEWTTITRPARYAASCATAATSALAICKTARTSS